MSLNLASGAMDCPEEMSHNKPVKTWGYIIHTQTETVHCIPLKQYSPCKHLPSFFKELCHVRPSYSPGFVLGKTVFIWRKYCALIGCWG